MNGLGGLNKSPGGVVVGLVQLQNPVVATPDDLAAQCRRICDLTAKARRRNAEHGPGRVPRVLAARPVDGHQPGDHVPPRRARGRRRSGAPAATTRIWGCFSIMEENPRGNPYNTGIIIDDRRRAAALLPQAAPLGAGRAVGAGRPRHPGVRRARTAAASALIICHDGMFPEMARECAYKGAEIMIRTAGYTAPDPPRLADHQPGQRVLQPDGAPRRVCMCGSDGTFDSMGEGMIVGFDGVPTGRRAAAAPTRSSPPRCAPTWCARRARGWGVENNIYQLGHRGYVAVKGGARDCPYTFMQDLVAGRYRLPWEDEVVHRDGTSCGFPPPTREYSPARRRPRLSSRSSALLPCDRSACGRRDAWVKIIAR